MGVLVCLERPYDLIGRRSALSFWDGLLARLDTGSGAVVDLSGEPGTGKSRMLAEFSQRARRRGFEVESDWSAARAQDRSGARVVLLDDVGRVGGAPVADVVRLLGSGPCEDAIVVVSRRPRQTPPQLMHALEMSGAARLSLEGLGADELGPLSADRICGPHRRRELRESGGNPEYVKILAALCGGPGECAGGPLPAQDLALPGAAAGILADFANLGDTAKLLVHAAAVVGGVFDPALLAEVARLPQEAVLDGIDELLGADLVRLTGSVGELRFRDRMVRWVLYAMAPGGWRFGAHLRVLRLLRERGEPADRYAIHVERTGRVGDLDAVGMLARAGESTSQLDPEAAVYWYEAALRLLPAGLAHTALRDRLTAALVALAVDRPGRAGGRRHAVPLVHALHAVPFPAGSELLRELSARELQVAVLVSQGRTNQQIGRELGVSHKTVETHLSRIFAKLEVGCRAEVANLVGRTVGSGVVAASGLAPIPAPREAVSAVAG